MGISTRRRTANLLVFGLLLVACGGDTENSTSSTALVTTTTSTTTSQTPATTAPTTSSTTTTTAAPNSATTAEVLVAGPDGVFLIGPDRVPELLIEGPAVFAVDDFAGGVLFQQERRSRERRSIVYRVRAGEGVAIETLVAAPDQGLVLNGVARDGDTYVYYTRLEGSTPEDTRDTLRRYSLQTREVTELADVGGWESGAYPISISDRLILFNWFAEAERGMNFTDLEANKAAVAADPTPEGGFFDCGPCPDRGELSADSGQLVYREVVDGVDYAIIKHVASGAEIRRIEMGGINRWHVVSFDLTDEHLVVNRATNDDPLPAWIYDLGLVDPRPVELPIAGEAYLTRFPVTVTGIVPAP